jgi:hypothetical protein
MQAHFKANDFHEAVHTLTGLGYVTIDVGDQTRANVKQNVKRAAKQLGLLIVARWSGRQLRVQLIGEGGEIFADEITGYGTGNINFDLDVDSVRRKLV